MTKESVLIERIKSTYEMRLSKIVSIHSFVRDNVWIVSLDGEWTVILEGRNNTVHSLTPRFETYEILYTFLCQKENVSITQGVKEFSLIYKKEKNELEKKIKELEYTLNEFRKKEIYRLELQMQHHVQNVQSKSPFQLPYHIIY